MARKKKNTLNNYTDTVGYKGAVKVSIQKGNKIIKTTTYKNTGKTTLFKFIAYALGGTFSTADRPCRVMLFTNTETEGKSGAVVDRTKLNFEDTGASTMVLQTSADVPAATDTGYTITYHFRIPYSYITESEIYKVGLYPNNTDTTGEHLETRQCAYYLFTKPDPTDESKELWDPIVKSTGTESYSIIIEWTLLITNK